ncbi:MAG: hypothetical protein HY558_01150 [Euryarchaeota archaeon]|nr:hypothetical protein [Euryarchaeota archaeon]
MATYRDILEENLQKLSRAKGEPLGDILARVESQEDAIARLTLAIESSARRDEMEDLRTELYEVRKSVEALPQKVLDLRDLIERERVRLEGLRSLLRLDEMPARVSEMRDEIAHLARLRAETGSGLQEIGSRLSEMKSEVEARTTQLTQLQGLVAQAVGDLPGTVKDLVERVEKDRGRVRSTAEQAERLHTATEGLVASVEQERGRLRGLSASLEEDLGLATTVRKDLGALPAEVARLRERLEDLRAQFLGLRDQVAQAENQVPQVLEALAARVTEAQNRTAEFTAEVARVVETIAPHMEELRKTEQEMGGRMEELRGEFQKSRDDFHKLRNEYAETLTTIPREMDELREQVGRERTQVQEVLQALEGEVSRLPQRVQEIHQGLEAQAKQLDEVRRRLDRAFVEVPLEAEALRESAQQELQRAAQMHTEAQEHLEAFEKAKPRLTTLRADLTKLMRETEETRVRYQEAVQRQEQMLLDTDQARARAEAARTQMEQDRAYLERLRTQLAPLVETLERDLARSETMKIQVATTLKESESTHRLLQEALGGESDLARALQGLRAEMETRSQGLADATRRTDEGARKLEEARGAVLDSLRATADEMAGKAAASETRTGELTRELQALKESQAQAAAAQAAADARHRETDARLDETRKYFRDWNDEISKEVLTLRQATREELAQRVEQAEQHINELAQKLEAQGSRLQEQVQAALDRAAPREELEALSKEIKAFFDELIQEREQALTALERTGE